jgi:acyl-CoA thioesterase-1
MYHKRFRGRRYPVMHFAACICAAMIGNDLWAQDHSRSSPMAEAMRPFWLDDVMHSEPVLFIRDESTGESQGSLLFPAERIIAVTDSTGSITYEPGVDFRFNAGSREIIVPPGSRIVSKTAGDLRRPANSQKYKLTHRDGGGEILFGAKLEYHEMQTSVTYAKADSDWPTTMPTFDSKRLPHTIEKLAGGKEVKIVLLGDSISTGCNASGWARGAPDQPPYPELLRQRLASYYNTEIELINLSVGGKSTPWGVDRVADVVAAKPDLVILAFGMNDSAALSAKQYGDNTAKMISMVRDRIPKSEFILVASMLGNRDWTLLNHEAFPEFRDRLKALCQRGVALADMTSVWEEFLKRKKDADLTGNGVNHPNDFGHRVYAQVIAALLLDPSQ